MASLGLSPRLLDALDRIGAQTVGQLLNLPRIRLYRNQGLGQRTVREIRRLAEHLGQYLATQGKQPLPVPVEELEPDETRAAPEQLSVDLMARLLVPQSLEAGEGGILLAFLGLDNGNAGGAWVSQQDLAERNAVGHDTVQRVLQRARERWGKQQWITVLRQEIATLIEKSGGVMTADELAVAALTAHASAADEPQRSRWAVAESPD